MEQFFLSRRRNYFARRKITIEIKRIGSKEERKGRAKNLLIENIAYESTREKGWKRRRKGNFDEMIIKIFFLDYRACVNFVLMDFEISGNKIGNRGFDFSSLIVISKNLC